MLLGVGQFLAERGGLAPDPSPFLALGIARARLPGHLVLGGWLLETLGLVALYLLVRGRSGRWWLDGLATGLVAWIFRGPLAVLSALALAELPRRPFWEAARLTLLLYPAAGLLLAAVAERSNLSERLPGD